MNPKLFDRDNILEPLFLTAQTVVTPGSTATVNQSELLNPQKRPMLVTQFRFRVEQTEFDPLTDLPNGTIGAGLVNEQGAVIAFKASLGKFPLTNGFVPVFLAARPENTDHESWSDYVGPVQGLKSDYIVKLPRPMYVPAGAAVQFEISHRGQQSETLRVYTSLIGFSVKGTPPKQITLPYFASYISKTFDTTVSEDSDSSSALDLVNSLDSTIVINGFTGRIQVNQPNAPVLIGTVASPTSAISNFSSENQYMNFGFDFIRLRLQDSLGNPFVRDYAPFWHVFQQDRRMWDLTSKLAPRAYYTTDLLWTVPLSPDGVNPYYSPTPATNTLFRMQAQVFVGMFGYRNVVGDK